MRRHISNSAWSTAGFILPTAALVLTTPVFTRELGMEGFGVYALITTLLGMNGLASFGLADATTKFVAEQTRHNKALLSPLIQASCALYLTFSVFSGLIVYLLAPSLIDKLFSIPTVWSNQATSALKVGSLVFALRLLESFVGSISLGFSRYEWISKIDMVGGLLVIGSQTLLLQAGHGLVALTTCVAVVSAATTLSKLFLAIGLVGGVHAFVPCFYREQTRALLTFSCFSWLQSINQILGAQADRLLIAGLLNTQALSYYVVCTRAASLVQIIPARATSFIFPFASEQHAAGHFLQLRKAYFFAQNSTIVLSLILAVPLFLYAPSILTLWLGESVAANATTLLRILVVTYSLLAGSILPFYYLNGTGMPGLNAAFGWAGSILNGVALFLFLPTLQLVGAAWAKLLPHSILLVCLPILHRTVFKDNRWYVGFLNLLVPTIIFTLLSGLVNYVIQPSSVSTLIAQSAAVGLATCITATPLVFYFNPVLGVSSNELISRLLKSVFPAWNKP